MSLKDTRLTLQVAMRKTGNWRLYNSLNHPEEPLYVRAFRIPKETIDTLAGMPDAIDFRAYLAMEDSLNPSNMSLLLVPIGTAPDGRECDLVERGVYDFTTPCPDSCDFQSVLFKGLTEQQEQEKK